MLTNRSFNDVLLLLGSKLEKDPQSTHLADPRFLNIKEACLFLLQYDLLLGTFLQPPFHRIESVLVPLPVNLWLSQQHAILHVAGDDKKGHAVVWDAVAGKVRDPSSRVTGDRPLRNYSIQTILPVTELK